MDERRKSGRKKVTLSTVIRKTTPEGGYSVMEFKSGNLSLGGIFISTEDLSIFDMGDEVDILVDADQERYYEGKARIVRSARVFSDEGEQIESGFGLMFLNPDEAFKEMLEHRIHN